VLVTDEGGADDGGPSTSLRDARTGEVRWRADGALVPAHRRVDRSGLDEELLTSDVVLLRRGTSVVGVDRADGGFRWGRDGVASATLCGGVAVFATGDGHPGTAAEQDALETIAVTTDGGQEVWTAPGLVGGCQGGDVAVASSAEVVVRDAATGAEEGRVAITGDEPTTAVPLGDRVVVQRRPGDEVDGVVSVHHRSGGDVLLETAGAVVEVEGDDLVRVQTELDDTVVRASTGAVSINLGRADFVDDECGTAMTATVVVGCISLPGVGPTEVAAWALDADQVTNDPVWMTYDAGPADAIAIVRVRLYTVSANRLIAYD
jgi:hypothetical protein